MSDLIKREDTIDAIQTAYCTPCKERGDDHNEVRCRACEFDDAMMQIDSVPSVDAIPCEVADKIGEENEKLTDRIGQLEEQMRWIPCSERLPTKRRSVLITTNEDFVGEACYWATTGNHVIWKGYRWEATYWDDEVIAWMPLPKPYREENEE